MISMTRESVPSLTIKLYVPHMYHNVKNMIKDSVQYYDWMKRMLSTNTSRGEIGLILRTSLGSTILQSSLTSRLKKEQFQFMQCWRPITSNVKLTREYQVEYWTRTILIKACPNISYQWVRNQLTSYVVTIFVEFVVNAWPCTSAYV